MNSSARARRFYILTLLLRTVVFLLLAAYAICLPDRFAADLAGIPFRITPLTIFWLWLIVAMLLRFFPSPMESLGCQKVFAKRFRPSGQAPSCQEQQTARRGALWVLLSWVALNALFFLGYWKGVLGAGFMFCLSAFYSVCDIICILFFCPFQSWMMHNRCCTTCRIYNWDFFMISTPLLCLPNILAVCAYIIAIALLLRWEITYFRHRERFFESSNEALRCSQCRDQLCRYKRRLSRKGK